MGGFARSCCCCYCDDDFQRGKTRPSSNSKQKVSEENDWMKMMRKSWAGARLPENEQRAAAAVAVEMKRPPGMMRFYYEIKLISARAAGTESCN